MPNRFAAVSVSGLSRYQTEELMGSDKVISLVEITEVVPRMNFVLGCIVYIRAFCFFC